MYRGKALACDFTTMIVDEKSIACKKFDLNGKKHQDETELINIFKSFLMRRHMPMAYAISLLGNITLAMSYSNHNFEYNGEDHLFHCYLYSLKASEADKVVFDVILEPINSTLYLRLISK